MFVRGYSGSPPITLQCSQWKCARPQWSITLVPTRPHVFPRLWMHHDQEKYYATMIMRTMYGKIFRSHTVFRSQEASTRTTRWISKDLASTRVKTVFRTQTHKHLLQEAPRGLQLKWVPIDFDGCSQRDWRIDASD